MYRAGSSTCPIRGEEDKEEWMVLFVCYPKCSTCRKAQKWLDDHGIPYDFRDIKEQNPTAEELALWKEKSGLPMKKFFNSSGQLYRSLGLKDKLKDMNDEEMQSLLSTDGMLVKRPILVAGDRVLVGYKETEYQELKDSVSRGVEDE